MQMLHSPFVTSGFVTEKETVIAMEYLSGGELFELIWKNDGLTEEQAKPIFYQIASAVAHCHKVMNSS